MTVLYPRMIRNISFLLVTTSALALWSSTEAMKVEDLHLEEARSINDVTRRVGRAISTQKKALEEVSASLESADESTSPGLAQQKRQIKDDIRLIRLAAIGKYQILTGLTDVGPDQKPRIERSFHEERTTAHFKMHDELMRALSSLPVTSDSPTIGADLGRLAAHANRLGTFYAERPYDFSQQHTELFETSRGVYIGLSALRPYIYVKQEESGKAWGRVVFLTVPPIRSQEVTEAKDLLREMSTALEEDDASFIDRSGPLTLDRDAAVWGSEVTLPKLSSLTKRFIEGSSLRNLFNTYRADYVLDDHPSDTAAADASEGASLAPTVLHQEEEHGGAVLVTKAEGPVVVDDHAADQSSSTAAVITPALEQVQLAADGSGAVLATNTEGPAATDDDHATAVITPVLEQAELAADGSGAVLVTNTEGPAATDDHAAAAPALEQQAQLPADGNEVAPVLADLPLQQPESAQEQASQLTELPVVASGDASPQQATGIAQEQEQAAAASEVGDASGQPSADNTSVQQ